MHDLWIFLSLLEEEVWFSFLKEKVYSILKNELSKPLPKESEIVFKLLELFSPRVTDQISLKDQGGSRWQIRKQELLRACELNIIPICYGQSLYPKAFYSISDPPLKFLLQGNACWQYQSGLSIVGSRKISWASEAWMNGPLLEFCAKKKPLIISGGAIGVDQVAHKLALRLEIPSLVILPSGLFEVYPENLKVLIPSIIQVGGGVVSEYLPSQLVRKFHFQDRNRLIASIGNATLLVQAARKSGTCITAHRCLEYGKPLWVVPGHPMDKEHLACLDYMRMGATPVVDAQDLELFYDTETQELK